VAHVDTSSFVPPLIAQVGVGNSVLNMEMDSGSSLTLIDEHCYNKNFSNFCLSSSSVRLRAYTGELLDVIGFFNVMVTLRGESKELALHVVAGEKGSLFGRDWMSEFGMLDNIRNSMKCNQVTNITAREAQEELKGILKNHSVLFQGGIGRCKGVSLHIPVTQDFQPIFLPARNPPLALREKMDSEIDRLVQAGVLKSVTHSEWATPVIPVVKGDGTVKLAGLYNIPLDDILVAMFFDPAMAFKMTVKRRWQQGSSGERDTFGAAQHAPLMDIMIPSRANLRTSDPAP